MADLQTEQGGSFEAAYTGWKGWGEPDFGQLTPRDRATFRRELMRLPSFRNGTVKHVLEVGFGHGSFLTFCREQGWDVSGTEASHELVALGEKAGYSVYHADEMGGLASEQFDLIAGYDVVEHVPQHAMDQFLGQLQRLIRPGGVILLRFPNADSWLGNQNFNGDPTHVTAMGHFKLEYFCQRTDLSIEAFLPEVRLGFDGGVAKGIHKLVAGPLVTIFGWLVKQLYFPRSRMVLTTANVVAHLRRSGGRG